MTTLPTCKFQSSPPHKGRLCLRQRWPQDMHFNPRPHTKGDRRNSAQRLVLAKFQSSPPHKGRLSHSALGTSQVRISILAPTQRATRPAASPLVNYTISILAPTQRATFKLTGDSPTQRFQSSPPHKGRRAPVSCGTGPARISILAPTQRATAYNQAAGALQTAFQSSPPHKGRRRITLPPASTTKFQSSPPHKGRPVTSLSSLSGYTISILAPTQRATLGCA